MSARTSAHSAQSTSPTSGKASLQFEDNPSPLVAGPNRTQRAKNYEEKVEGLLNYAMRLCVESEKTVPDAAAILAHGPVFAAKVGDLADADERVRRAVDLITSGSENPYAGVVLAALPLVAQVMRNHETTDLSGSRRVEIRVPFTKRTVGFRMKWKLRNPFLRSMTQPPEIMTAHIFGNEQIATALAEQGVQIAWPSPNGKNSH